MASFCRTILAIDRCPFRYLDDMESEFVCNFLISEQDDDVHLCNPKLWCREPNCPLLGCRLTIQFSDPHPDWTGRKKDGDYF
jgi:hypothetical protein